MFLRAYLILSTAETSRPLHPPSHLIPVHTCMCVLWKQTSGIDSNIPAGRLCVFSRARTYTHTASVSRDGPTVDTKPCAVSAQPALFAEYRSDTSTLSSSFLPPVPLGLSLNPCHPPSSYPFLPLVGICELQERAPRAACTNAAPGFIRVAPFLHPFVFSSSQACLKIHPSLSLPISRSPLQFPHRSPAQTAR